MIHLRLLRTEQKDIEELYHIPNIQDMLLNLEGFQCATSLALNMECYRIRLDPASK